MYKNGITVKKSKNKWMIKMARRERKKDTIAIRSLIRRRKTCTGKKIMNEERSSNK